MIITRTPLCMSFFGDEVNMLEFFKERGGAVLSANFDKYCYINVRHLPRFLNYSTELSYSKLKRVTRIEDIGHLVAREAMKLLGMHELRLAYKADLPACSGLGTNSSFAVGMLNVFYTLKGKYADKKRLADEAICLERELYREAGGWQGQIAASHGGLNVIRLNEDGYRMSPVIVSAERRCALNENLMLFFTDFSHFSSDAQTTAKKALAGKTAELREIHVLADETERILIHKESDLDEPGRMFDTSWQLECSVSAKISTDPIDRLYMDTKKADALSRKLLGTDGDSLLLFYMEKEGQTVIHATLSNPLYVPPTFENGDTTVVFYEPESYIAEQNTGSFTSTKRHTERHHESKAEHEGEDPDVGVLPFRHFGDQSLDDDIEHRTGRKAQEIGHCPDEEIGCGERDTGERNQNAKEIVL